MTPERWKLIKEVFEAASGRDVSSRASFLDEACKGDRVLRSEVERLLSVQQPTGDFLEHPIARMLARLPEDATHSDHSAARAPQMTIGLGSRIGSYEVTALLGEGGMGRVWRAHHTALKRDDAVKVLPDAFASDPERLARFRREAQVLASLNHPNIAHVHGLEQADGVQALVMELVDGPTLADRIAQGPIPVDEALPIARQICEAFEAAHEQGIIHRDLKPANIKVRPDGTVKVLDFGLAKALEPMSARIVDPTASPTITSPAMVTGAGMLLGTAAYMSPEQARGKAVDKRSDIWAFGCVLYEMLTGHRTFDGDDVSDVLASVLTREPDWGLLPSQLSLTLTAYMKRCLHKNAKERLRDIGDMRLALDGAFDSATAVSVRAATMPRRALPWIAGILLGGVLVGVSTRTLIQTPSRPVTRFLVTLPDMPFFNGFQGAANVAISPDGTRIVYRGNAGGRAHLYVRRIDQLDGTSLFTTDGEFMNPVVSSDGAWVVFRGPDRTWKKVAIVGGPAVTIFPAGPPPRGASWGPNDTIIFSEGSVLLRVPVGGGEPAGLTSLDKKRSELGHLWPEVLPSGSAVLFTVARGVGIENHDIAVLNLTTGERQTLLAGGSRPRYAPTGHLIYGVSGTLMAVPFDPDRLQVLGNAVPVLQNVLTDPLTGAVEFALSADGSLVYVTGESPQVTRSLVWVDRNGREETLKAPLRAYTSPRISPDGSKVALSLRDEESDIWVWDFSRETLTRLSFDPQLDRFPVWSPDGRRLAFNSMRYEKSRGNAFWQASDGSGTVERLAEGGGAQIFPTSFSPDGSRLLVYGDDASSDQDNDDIAVIQLQGERRVIPLMRTMFNEQHPEVSPDGRWLAYNSDESGRHEVYVRPFPDIERGRWQVSTAGGSQPTWARNGRELFFRSGTAVMSVPIKTEPGFASGNPTVVFQGEYATPPGRTYDVSPDGRRFLMIKEATQDKPQAPIILVQNWQEELKRLVPTR
jgi:serine/threonine-protein kinase